MKIFQNFKIEGYLDFIKEKYKDYPITLYWDYPVDIRSIDTSRINLFMSHEPGELFEIHNWLLGQPLSNGKTGSWVGVPIYKAFHGIIAWDKKLLSHIDNGIEFQCSWRINNDPIWEFLGDKKFETTFLSGTKNLLEGHALRHKVFNIKDQITTPHRWYKVLEDFDNSSNTRPGYNEYSKDLSHIPLEAKYEPHIYGKKHLYKNTMFNVAIENVNKPNWLVEKIYSCFSSKTIPLYWGCPNLEEFGYDERGVIRFNNEKDLLNILNNLTEEDYYNRLPYIEYNYKINQKDTLKDKMFYILDEIIKSTPKLSVIKNNNL